MRAKFIFEGLDFERHQDPLDSLGIGDVERRKGVIRVKKDPELAFLETFGIDTLLKTTNAHGGIVYIWHIRQATDLGTIYMGIGYLDGDWRLGYWKKSRNENWKIPNVLGVKDESWDSLYDTRFEEYEDEIKNNDWIDSSNPDSPKTKAISDFFNYNINGYDKKLKESQNFERGGDPLDTLNIGQVQERKLEKIFRKLQGIAIEYDVDINDVKLDGGFLYCSVEISGRRYAIGLSPDYINGEDDSYEYNCAWEDLTTHDVSNDTFETEFDTLDKAAAWVRDQIDSHADNYMNESHNFTREDNPLDSMDIGRVQQRKIQKHRDGAFEMMKEFVREINGDPSKIKNITIEQSKRIPWRISYEILEDVGYTTVRNVYQISYTIKNNFHINRDFFRVKLYTQDVNDKTYNDLRLTSATFDLENEDLNSVLEDCKEKLLHYFNDYGEYKNL